MREAVGGDTGGPIFSSLPVNDGVMLASTKGWRATKQLLRFGTDGSSRGQQLSHRKWALRLVPASRWRMVQS